jgi:hypothetical protein
MQNSQTSINLKNFKPFYYFNTESRLKNFNKEENEMIKVNGVTYYRVKGNHSEVPTSVIELEDLVIDEIKEINSEDFIADYETVL